MATGNVGRAEVVPGWVLLPLRGFLGVTFTFAGLQKLADHNYLASAAPTSVKAQLDAYAARSPIGGVLATSSHHATAVGLAIALGELAVGLGALLGLWTRVAAVGGMVLSASFLLAVSWHSHPYYLGPDIVFLVAWTPLALAGAGSQWSLDAHLRERAREDLHLPPDGTVAVEFGTVRRLCGHLDHGRCRAQRGAACRPDHCPVLAEPSPLQGSAATELDRRTFLRQAGTAGRVAVGGLVAAGLVGGVGRLLASPVATATPQLGGASAGGGPSTTGVPPTSPDTAAAPTTPSTAAAPDQTPAGPTTTSAAASGESGTALGQASVVPVGGAASFTDPYTGQPGIITQPTAGDYRAFSAVCTHQGCQVGFRQQVIFCPCHGAEFDPSTGAVLRGPAERPLPGIDLTEGADGQLYVQS